MADPTIYDNFLFLFLETYRKTCQMLAVDMVVEEKKCNERAKKLLKMLFTMSSVDHRLPTEPQQKENNRIIGWILT